MNPGFRPVAVVIHEACEPRYVDIDARAAAGDKRAQIIWTRLQTALDRIRQDGQWGEVIPTSKIPRYFGERYCVGNLYCIDLARDVRAFYSIHGHKVVLLDIMDHDAYDQLFRLR